MSLCSIFAKITVAVNLAIFVKFFYYVSFFQMQVELPCIFFFIDLCTLRTDDRLRDAAFQRSLSTVTEWKFTTSKCEAYRKKTK